MESEQYSNPTQETAIGRDMSRRRFMGLSAIALLGLTAADWIHPASASANDDVATQAPDIKERYRIFVPNSIVAWGGTQTLVLRSGETYEIKIPPGTVDQTEFTIRKRGLQGNDIFIIVHTLYDPTFQIDRQIRSEIESANFIQDVTKPYCGSAYIQVIHGKPVENIAALDLLDYVVASSKLDEKNRQRYEVASHNSRLVAVEKAISDVLANSKLDEAQKKTIWGTHQYVRADDPVPNFEDLTELAAIVAGSKLSSPLKQYYLQAVAKAKAVTADFMFVQLIAAKFTGKEREKHLSAYQKIRQGKKVSNQKILESLDNLILNANILVTYKVLYLLAKDPLLKDAGIALEEVSDVWKVANTVKNTGATVVPIATNVLSVLGAEAGTGIAINSLTGAAATNATLAFLGGGSVAAGGFGMLGGLAVVTGGAALIGAAGFLSVALVSQMNGEDFKNLGVAGLTGTLSGGASVLIAWTVVSVLGLTGELTGAAAITAMISLLGGLSFITGGAAFIAFGTGFVVWSFLNGHKSRDNHILHQLEARLYILLEEPSSNDSIFALLQKNLSEKHYHSDKVFLAPEIPVDTLSDALNQWGTVSKEEKVLAFIDTSGGRDQADIFFTNQRIIWKEDRWSGCSYSALNPSISKHIAGLLTNEEDRSSLADMIWELHNTLKQI